MSATLAIRPCGAECNFHIHQPSVYGSTHLGGGNLYVLRRTALLHSPECAFMAGYYRLAFGKIYFQSKSVINVQLAVNVLLCLFLPVIFSYQKQSTVKSKRAVI